MATGGTGGHIYPAVATAKELLSRGHQVLMLGQAGGMEERVSAEQDLPFFGVAAGKLARSGQGRADPREIVRAAQGVSQARATLQRLRPAVVVGYGGFASLPGVLAAQSLGLPTVLHEQNALLGLTQKIAVGRSRAVGTAYEHVRGLPAGKGTLVGMPVREQKMDRAVALAQLGLQDGPLTILIMGGSQGSLFLNTTLPGTLHNLFGSEGLWNMGNGDSGSEEVKLLNFTAETPPAASATSLPEIDLDFTSLGSGSLASGPLVSGSLASGPVSRPTLRTVPTPQPPADWSAVQVIHSTGTRWLGDVRPQVADLSWYRPVAYVDAVAAWSVADLAITRAGTSTLAEAAFHGVPLVMVPLPESAENHQYHNALAVEQAGAGRVVEQKDAPESLGQAVLECAVPGTRRTMREAALARAQPGAAARFADLIEQHLR